LTRPVRHLLFLAGNTLALGLCVLVLPYTAIWERLSVGSAWLCMFLLSSALLTGPVRRAANRPAPANIYLRRDLGAWAAFQAFLHFYAGTVVSMNQTYIQAFVNVDASPFSVELRDRMFGWGASIGLVVAIIFLLLLAISSDRAIRWLGAARWKKIQKSAHAVLWLTVLHGFAFQLLEARYGALVLLALLTVTVFVLQLRGRRANG
jgi:DMSO/TMAO reductase YedYZ heme-binding membrane subunit